MSLAFCRGPWGTSRGASERRGILWRWRGPSGLRWVWRNGRGPIREGSWASRGSAGAEGKRCEGCSAQKTVTASGWIRPHVRCGCRPKPVPKVPTLHKNWGFTLRHRGSHSRVLSVARTGPGFKNHCKGEIPKPDRLPFSQHVLRHPRT